MIAFIEKKRSNNKSGQNNKQYKPSPLKRPNTSSRMSRRVGRTSSGQRQPIIYIFQNNSYVCCLLLFEGLVYFFFFFLFFFLCLLFFFFFWVCFTFFSPFTIVLFFGFTLSFGGKGGLF